MTPRPYRPLAELEGALERGDLDFAITLAMELSGERGRPIELDLALRFLPLVAVGQPDAFDAWALHWLERWCRELRGRASIDDSVDVARGLAEIPVEPERGMDAIRTVSAGNGRKRML